MLPRAFLFEIKRTCQRNGANPQIVCAIIEIESAWNPNAVRYEKGWKHFYRTEYFSKKLFCTEATEMIMQSCSWGLMQVMGTVARELDFTEALPLLLSPELAINYGSLKVARLQGKYTSTDDIASAYNAGTPLLSLFGDYKNQVYVDRFNIAMSKYKDV